MVVHMALHTRLFRRAATVLSLPGTIVNRAALRRRGRGTVSFSPRLEALEVRNLLSASAVYDVAFHFSYVGSPGNASVAVDGFSPPSSATVPATRHWQCGLSTNWRCSLCVRERPDGDHRRTVCHLSEQGGPQWRQSRSARYRDQALGGSVFARAESLFGQINLVENAAPGTHYRLAASYWADKPLVNANLFDFAYFDNSLYNGTTVAIDNSQGKALSAFPCSCRLVT